MSEAKKIEIKKIAKKVNQEFGVLSLTKAKTNLLMWVHYAEEHRGAVVAIDVNDPAFCYPGEQRGEVDYMPFRPQVPATQEVMLRHFFYKSQDWQYEDEYRIVRRFGSIEPVSDDRHGNQVYLFPLPKSALREIILGANVSADKIDEIRELGSSAASHVILEQAVVDNRRFGMGFRKV